MSFVRMWLTVDWDAPGGALRAMESYVRAVRAGDPAQLAVAAGGLPEEEAGARLMELIANDPELSGRVSNLPDIVVYAGDVPAEVEDHLRLPGPGEPALHVLREELAPYVAVTPVLNQAEWARTWQPEAGFRHLVIDNASDDGTAQILADRGADVVVNDRRVSRVDNWRRALQVFLEIGDAEWMKWVFAGDRLLPGAADVLDAAIGAHPKARVISAAYQWRHGDGSVTDFRTVGETKLVTTVEALSRFVLQGNWMGGPIAMALHRDVVEEIDFGAHSWVADWQASMSLALDHPILHVNELIGLFDASRTRHHTAHAYDISTVVQDSAMRYQALEHLRERAADVPYAQLEGQIDEILVTETSRRLQARREAAAPKPRPTGKARGRGSRPSAPGRVHRS